MKRRLDEEILETMRKNPDNWRGVFYVNSKDPRLIVPKLDPGLGWTFNFGSPYAWVTMLLILLIVILSKFFL